MASGGAWQDAQRKAWFEPFSKETGTKIVEQEYLGDLGKVKAMVDTGNVPIDLVTVETATVLQGCDAGILERLDYSKIAPREKFIEGSALDCGVGLDAYGDILAYDPTVLKEAPTSVLDLFDTTKFPGKRAMRKFPAQNLEWALMADGVATVDVYKVLGTPEGVDRAFKKLDTIKADIVWWSGGAQSQQLLASGEAPIGMFWNGRIFAIQADNPSVGLSWNQNLTAADVLVVPKGAKNKAAAMKFLAQATSAQGQADVAEQTNYAPTNVKSAVLMDPKDAATLPDKFTTSQINLDMAYWAEHRDEIGKRWYDWQAK